ncbi:MAG: hypothetical protein WCG85_02165 [Polyangia bacterium]
MGTITVQSVRSGTISRHDVCVELPDGWAPDRPEESEWNMLWGPEFLPDGKLRIWLPDDAQELLTLPLPSQIVITRPLAAQRSWLE